MSKQIKKTESSKGNSGNLLANFDLGSIIPDKFKTPAAILGIILLLVIFYSPVMFGDKTVKGTDYIQMKSMREYIHKDHDGFSLWNPYIFCGMPAYVTSTELRWFDLSAVIYSSVTKVYSAVFTDSNAIYTFSFLLMAITAFMFMRSRGAGHGVSFLVAAAMIFSTGISVLYFIGHVTKLMSLALLPFILMMLLKFQKKITLLDVFLLTFGMHLLVLGAHVQIVFYAVLFTAIFFIFYLVYALIKKDNFLLKQTGKSLGVFTLAAVIALLMSFDTYYQLYMYKPYSTRGTQSIAETSTAGQPQSASASYEYSTDYSFSPGELVTFLFPSYYGFGNSTYHGPIDQLNGREINTYFGQMPMVDEAMYMGIIILVLGLFAFFILWKEPFIKYMAVVLVFFILISFGRTFPVIYNLMYNNFPLFNNFRVPSMVLHVIQIFFPLLAGLGIAKIIELKKEGNLSIINPVRILAFLFTGLLILSFPFSSVLSKGIVERVAESPYVREQAREYFQVLSDYIADMFVSDVHIGLLLAALAFWAIYLFMKSKLSNTVLVTALTLFVLVDLFRISSRGTTFEEARVYNDLFKEPSYVKFIKEQNDKEPFRIVNLKMDQSMGSVNMSFNFNVNFLLEDLYGYSAAKPRGIQDVMSIVGPQNPSLWRMANVKYVIINQAVEQPGFTLVKNDQSNYVYKFEGALPRAYFVDSVAAKSGLEALNTIAKPEFDAKKLAFVDNVDFQFSKPETNASVKIVKYSDAKLELEAKATGNNFLFFSTNYIVPGWKALVDGNETKIYKTNHTFMGIVVPQGQHKVEFVYQPSGFAAGKYLSLILNVLLFAGIIALVLLQRKKKEVVPAE
jgi:hypothetical protein